MRLRVTALAVFLFQIALGDLCMMQMASAQEMDMPPMHGSHHCENCSPDDEGMSDKTPMQGMDCGDGHCLMHDRSDQGTVVQTTNPLSTVTLPPSPNALLLTILTHTGPLFSASPPDIPFSANEVVLRC